MNATPSTSSPSLGVIRAVTTAVGPPTLAKDGDLSAPSKRCKKCGIEKPLTEFYPHKKTRDKHRSACKLCAAIIQQKWDAANVERRRATSKKWNIVNAERARVRRKIWLTANAERIATLQRIWNQANADRIRELARNRYNQNSEKMRLKKRAKYNANPDRYRAYSRKSYHANREKRLSSMQKWKRDNPEKAKAATKAWRLANPTKYKLADLHRRTRRLKAPGAKYLTTESLKARFDYYGSRCYICGAPATVIEHVIPLARGGTSFPSSIRPACKSCNCRKSSKSLAEFIAYRGEPLWQPPRPRLP